MLEMLAGQAVSSLFGGVGKAIADPGGPILSGAPVDARSFMDGSGWVVSTGSSRAQGGDRQQGDPFGPTSNNLPPAMSGGPMQAGFSGLAGGLLLLVVLGAIWRARQ